jgi:lipopolysaccharide transport system ATP-binding protein
MAEPILEIKGVSKSYRIRHQGKEEYWRLSETLMALTTHPVRTYQNSRMKKERFWALKDINLTVDKGEMVGVIGRNGAGKSTLLKILSHITYPAEGEVILRGRVGSLLEVGTGFHPELTGRENIFLNGAILGMRKTEIERQFDAIVKFAEIERFLDTPVKRYSSGMYVRLAFAVAAHRRRYPIPKEMPREDEGRI